MTVIKTSEGAQFTLSKEDVEKAIAFYIRTEHRDYTDYTIEQLNGSGGFAGAVFVAKTNFMTKGALNP